ncbi:serine hydroxymethyltransferase [Candidatus Carsonella ruddii]|uniref:Serine hydroxymethyltransferase n=1 Tax=Candidatus Carsonella ruddii PC isolate NHV TaxID=1202540 RepID=J3YQL9_CARRU|nr:serine hydroxymethyltransferase [Candidatus Carsonella ruddii]AFP84258.1 serine hydroxymethyltransferase [Candidatus Carsonella ruddii PC isolate NHV]
MNLLNTLKFLKIESKKQEKTINLIASENYSSLISILYSSSCLINKYTEGYPNQRYYSGCKFFDIIENKTILEAQNLFNSNYANVQSHSGSQANFSGIQSLINKNEKILSLDLKSGGHLTHGFIKNFSGKYFDVVNYLLDKNYSINKQYLYKIIKKEKPKVLILGYSSYQKYIDWGFFNYLSLKNNFFIISDISHISGLIASGLYPSPLIYSNLVTTTTHKTLRGIRGGLILTQNYKLIKKINLSVFPGQQGGCLANNVLGKFFSFKESNNINFLKYTKQIIINSKIMLKTFLYRGYESIDYNTENHMFIIKIKNINSFFLEKKLEKYGILINKNFIPNDKNKSLNPSGIRIGSSCITTRKIKKLGSELISNYICDLIKFNNNFIKIKIRLLCLVYPIYK